MKRKFFFSFMIVVMMTSAGNSVSQNFIVENDDPFVRGLQRQKTFDGFQKRIGNVTNKNNLKQREENTQRIFDFPNFNQILSFSHYRVDGLLVLEAPQSPGMESLLEAVRMEPKGPLIEVKTSLKRDPSTVSRYDWGGGPGPSLQLTTGTPTEVRVLVAERRPISYVIPILRDLTGIY